MVLEGQKAVTAKKYGSKQQESMADGLEAEVSYLDLQGGSRESEMATVCSF